MKFTSDELKKIDYLVYKIHSNIILRMIQVGLPIKPIPTEYQNLNINTLATVLNHHRAYKKKLTYGDGTTNTTNINVEPVNWENINDLLYYLDYIKGKLDELNLGVESFKNSEVMSICIWSGTIDLISSGILSTITIPAHAERLKLISIDFKYKHEIISVNNQLANCEAIYEDCLNQYIFLKKNLIDRRMFLFNQMVKANPFKQMEDANFKDSDWQDLYNHCLEIYCDTTSLGHKFIVPEASMYKSACYLLYFLNNNSDTFKKSQLSSYKINLRKKAQRKKQNALGIKTLEIKLNEDTVKKLKELQQYNKLTQSEIIEILINNDYKNTLG